MSLLVKSALDWACVWHANQTRKYPGAQVPYASHIAGVALTLAKHGFDEEVQAAGALHDVVEDCGVTLDELGRRFSPRVADLVRHVSEEDKSLSWEERKQKYAEHFSRKPWEAQAITLADKIDNFRSIRVCARDHGDPWAMFKRGKEAQIVRFKDLEARLEGIAPHPLVDEYRAELALLAAV